MPDGCGAETTRARTCLFRAFVGKTFTLSALRFIVAVSFFGFNVRVLDSLMNAPLEFPGLGDKGGIAWVWSLNCTG
jgi:hypothetical protein